MKCNKCDGKGTLPGNTVKVTHKDGVTLLESVCASCFNGEVPGQTEFWMCRCDVGTESVFLHENRSWYFYEPGAGWARVKEGNISPLYRMVRKT